ncbi:hypothetical protein GCM10017711_10500 [Paeniglutamicibacter sulfureus]
MVGILTILRPAASDANRAPTGPWTQLLQKRKATTHVNQRGMEPVPGLEYLLAFMPQTRFRPATCGGPDPAPDAR